MDLTKADRAKAGAAMAKALAEKRMTSTALGVVANVALGYRAQPYQEPGYRLADAWLQTQRKEGLATYARVGRNTLWFFLPTA